MCKQLFCPTCGKKVDYVMRCRVGDHVVHGVEIHYFEKYCICKECYNELVVPGLDKVNDLRVEDCYRLKLGLIPLSQFNRLVEDYGLERLSQLSQISCETLQRYQAGTLITREDSEKLQCL